MDYSELATQAIHQASQQVESLLSSPDWEYLGDPDDIHCYKRTLENGINMTKGVGLINKSAEEIRSLLWTYNRKKEWDDSLEEIYVISQFSEDFRLIYQRFSAPWPVSGRDFVFATKYYSTEQGILIIGQSIDANIPIKDGIVRGEEDPFANSPPEIVRGEVICSAYLLKPLSNTSTEVTYMVAIDPKGSIPTFIVNSVGKKQCLIVNKLKVVLGA